MKNNLCRLPAALLAVILVVAMLAACTGKTETESSTAASSSFTTAEETTVTTVTTTEETTVTTTEATTTTPPPPPADLFPENALTELVAASEKSDTIANGKISTETRLKLVIDGESQDTTTKDTIIINGDDLYYTDDGLTAYYLDGIFTLALSDGSVYVSPVTAEQALYLLSIIVREDDSESELMESVLGFTRITKTYLDNGNITYKGSDYTSQTFEELRSSLADVGASDFAIVEYTVLFTLNSELVLIGAYQLIEITYTVEGINVSILMSNDIFFEPGEVEIPAANYDNKTGTNYDTLLYYINIERN
jgi:hypothetical protein